MTIFATEFSSGPARLRVDVESTQERDRLLEDLTFLNYRLADVKLEDEVQSPQPHVLWYPERKEKDIRYENGQLILMGDWAEGELQKILVSALAMQLDKADVHPFHSSGVQYRGKTIMFLGGESNHGKTMSQLEGCRRGGQLISSETMVIDDNGRVVTGSKTVFLRKRAKGTERADLPDQDQGVAKFFDEVPDMPLFAGETSVDLVIMPAIDGHFDTSVTEMGQFESEYHSYHSMMNYMGLNQLVAPGLVMPIMDSDERRRKRAEFGHRFAAERPFYLIRARTPQILLDEVEKLLQGMARE